MEHATSSKARFILLNGVVGWGVPTGIAWAFFMSLSNGEPFSSYAPAALLMFPLGGAAFGWFMWRFSSGRAVPAESAPPVAASGRPALPVEVDTRPLRVIGGICGGFFLLLAVGASFTEPWPAAAFLAFVALGALLVAGAGTIRADVEHVEYTCPLGRFSMRWSDVTYLETDAQRQALVLSSERQRLPIVGEGYWSGARKSEFRAFLESQLAERNIPTRVSQLALIRLPRNARVKGTV